jgi:hypothetical protein
MTLLPGTPALRRRLALVALVVGALLVLRTAERDLPREQTLVFRTSSELRGAPVRLTASITRAGESEARSGFTIARASGDRNDIRHTFRAPNGDYVLTVDFLFPEAASSTADGAVAPPATPSPTIRETSSVHRVTLGGVDIVVPIGPRVSE